MSARRPVIYLLIAAGSLFVLFEAMSSPEQWSDKQYRDSRLVEDKAIVDNKYSADQTGARAIYKGKTKEELETFRKAARAQWDLAEWHYNRGEWADARREYQRIMDDFPYVELDYGYRTDDARKRIVEIDRYIAEERAGKGR